MSAFSDYMENLSLNWAFTDSTVTRPTEWYLALYTASPSDSGGGTELSGDGYSRQAISFGTSTSGTISNDGAVTFTAAGGDWGLITHAGIFDAASGGNLLIHGALTASKTINDGDSITFAVGSGNIAQA